MRQFNDTIRQIFACTPTELRRHRRAWPGRSRRTPRACASPIASPTTRSGTLAFLARRAVPGVEVGTLDDRSPGRSPFPTGVASVELVPDDGYVRARLRLDDLRDLTPAVQRCRHLLDLDADPVAVADHLGATPCSGPLARPRPGLRVPGTVDPHELAVRAVVGQQVSVASARRVLGRLVAEHGIGAVPGDPLGPEPGARRRLTHRFPDVATLAALDPDRLPLPRRRAHTVVTLAEALAGGDLALDVGADAEAARSALRTVPGIGPWTADYIAVRGLGHPDVMLSGDLGVRHAVSHLGLASTPAAVDELARRWRPWRSYATLPSVGVPPRRAGAGVMTSADASSTARWDRSSSAPIARGRLTERAHRWHRWRRWRPVASVTCSRHSARRRSCSRRPSAETARRVLMTAATQLDEYFEGRRSVVRPSRWPCRDPRSSGGCGPSCRRSRTAPR